MEIWCSKIFLWWFIITLPLSAPTNIITLTNERAITCVVSEPGEAAIFINPPVEAGFMKTADVNNWNKLDRFTENSDAFSYSPITSKCWEDLKLNHVTDGQYLDDKPIPISVYVRKSLNVVVYSELWNFTANFAVNKLSLTSSNGNWSHLILQRVNNIIDILLEDGVVQTEKIHFEGPYWVFFETSDMHDTFYKVHTYDSRRSETMVEEENFINVPFSNNLCLSMYVSVDKNSSLKITLETNNTITTQNVPGFNVENRFEKWQKIVLWPGSRGTGKLFFTGMHERNEDHGYWAVDDVTFCNQDTRFLKTVLNDWNKDDWSLDDSQASHYNPITDQRWQNLKFFHETDGLYLNDKSIPLSVYVRKSLNVVVYSQFWEYTAKFAVNKLPVIRSNGNWFHFILRRENRTIQILSEDKVVQVQKIDFLNGSYWVFFQSADLNNTFYKVHYHEFRWSHTTTGIAEQESYISVPFSDNLCLSMYVSVDENSFLRVTLISNNGNITTQNVSGFNPKNGFKKWKKIVLWADSPGIGKISFARMHETNEKYGYWAIDDVRFCSRDTEIYETTIRTATSEAHTCEMLNGTYKPIEMSFFNEPGFLGNMSCDTVLGPLYPYCEKHRICLNCSTCFCSWGYQGQSCDTTCDKGHHGLSCKKQCANCKRCHPQTGVCLDDNEPSNTYDAAVKEEPTFSNESGVDKITGLGLVKDKEKYKVDAENDDTTLHPSRFANKTNPLTATTNTSSTTPRISTAATGGIMVALFFLGCVVGCVLCVLYLKTRHHSTSTINQTDKCTRRTIGLNEQTQISAENLLKRSPDSNSGLEEEFL